MPAPAALAPLECYLAPGSAYRHYLRAGTLLVCTEGRLDLELPGTALADDWVQQRVQMTAGDTCQTEESGWVRCSASAPASLQILPAACAPTRLAGLLARIARRLSRAQPAAVPGQSPRASA